jgi:hypothetical protein
MQWFLVLLLSMLAAELLMRLPLARLGLTMLHQGRRAGRVVASPYISDHWKEMVMPHYTALLARLTVALAIILALAGAALAGALRAMQTVDPDIAAFLASPIGLAAGCLFATIHVTARCRLVRR